MHFFFKKKRINNKPENIKKLGLDLGMWRGHLQMFFLLWIIVEKLKTLKNLPARKVKMCRVFAAPLFKFEVESEQERML